MDGSATSAGAAAEGIGKPAGADAAWRREVMFRALTFAFPPVVLVVFWSAVTLAVLFFSRGLW